jgi:serine/threonine protein kinase
VGFHELFNVYKKIGVGTFASVYLAERMEDNMTVAVKTFAKAAAYAEEHGKVAFMNVIFWFRKQSLTKLIA